MKKIILANAAAVFVLTAVYTSCSNSQAKKGVGISVSNFDSTHSPVHDFFHFANGGWIKSNPIPSDQVRWGTFSVLAENNKMNMLRIAEDAANYSTAAKGSPEQMVGDFYFSAMDTVTIEKLGATPIKADMDAIDGVTDLNGVLKWVATLQRWGISPMFAFYAGQDPKNSEVFIPQLGQGGISLPDRDFYLNEDSRSSNIRTEFVRHVAKMFELYGVDAATAKKNSEIVMKIETELAKASMKREELRDPFLTYNKVSIAELNALTPSLKWDVMMSDLAITGKYDYLVLGQPEFLKELQKQLEKNSIENWKVYLKWNLLNLSANLLSTDFVNEDFHFNNKILAGQKQIQARWKRMVNMTDAMLGDAYGQLYVAKYFPPEAKKKADELVTNLISVYNKRIEGLDWMSDVTKVKAKEKLNAITRKIGYPDTWKDYKGLEISRESFFRNMVNATQWNYNFVVNQIGKPVDRSQWVMTPPTVNAYYNPSNNEIVFPAGILQPPFFNAQADDAVNYGGIGMVIGHELTHGFDDQGRNFDAKGNLSSWWTSDDSIKFVEKTNVLIDQFNSYTVLDTLHVNGKLTLGENIADLGGMAIAYDAFKLTKQGKGNELIDGLTPDQRFYLGFATVWAGDMRPEAQAQRVITDPHSPGLYRVNGTVCNLTHFYNAFGVKEGDKMYRPDSLRAKIW
jgi:putative endopeptidase